MSTQRSDIENLNSNIVMNESDKVNKVEKEWPACKKRKLDSKDDNIYDTSFSTKNTPVKRQSIGKNYSIT